VESVADGLLADGWNEKYSWRYLVRDVLPTLIDDLALRSAKSGYLRTSWRAHSFPLLGDEASSRQLRTSPTGSTASDSLGLTPRGDPLRIAVRAPAGTLAARNCGAPGLPKCPCDKAARAPDLPRPSPEAPRNWRPSLDRDGARLAATSDARAGAPVFRRLRRGMA